MADYAVTQGVARERILVEGRSATTQENIALSRELLARQGMPQARVLLVTSSFHAVRTAILAGAQRFTDRPAIRMAGQSLTYGQLVERATSPATSITARAGGSEPLRRPYLATPVRTLVRSRVVWLLVLAFGAALTVPLRAT